jgi:hypothetical protein
MADLRVPSGIANASGALTAIIKKAKMIIAISFRKVWFEKNHNIEFFSIIFEVFN